MTGNMVQARPEVAPGTPTRGRRADIEGLRAVAVLLVVVFHGGLPLSGGFVGVDVFFVISGFVIMGLLLPQLEAAGTLRLGQFYARRMRRLLPALALLILVTVVASTVLLSPLGPQQSTASTGAAASLFTANFELYRAGGGGYFDLPTEANALLHTWSLSVEEQFYLFLPAFLIVGWRLSVGLRRRWGARRVMAALVGGAGLVSFGLCVVTSHGHGIKEPLQFAFYSSPTRAWEFAAGAVLALGASRLARVPSRLAPVLGGIGAVLVAVSAVALSSTTVFPGTAALLPVVGTALLLVAGTVSTSGVSGALGWRPLVWIGGLSYSWYLWHWPVVVFARALWPGSTWVTVVAAAGSLVPAWVAWKLVETPIRHDARLVGRRMVPVAAVCILVPLVASLAVRASADRQAAGATYARLDTELAEHADVVRGCDQATPLDRRTTGDCTWRTEGATDAVYLVGDSNAGQFTEALAGAATRTGMDLTVATYSACPFVDLDLTGGTIRDGCRRYVQDTVRDLVARRPAVAVIASDSSAWVADGAVRITDPATGRAATSIADRAAAWRQGTQAVLQPLAAAGVAVLLVQTVPQFGSGPIAQCPPVRVLRDQATCAAELSRAEIDDQQGPTRDAVHAAADAVPGTRTIDVTDRLCPVDTCSMYQSGSWRYRDGAHITVGASIDLAAPFADAIGEAGRP